MRVRRTSSLDEQHGFYPFFGVNRPFDPEAKFVTARFISPLALGLIRLLFGLFGIAVIVYTIVLEGILVYTNGS
jgi:hypothetical protein